MFGVYKHACSYYILGNKQKPDTINQGLASRLKPGLGSKARAPTYRITQTILVVRVNALRPITRQSI